MILGEGLGLRVPEPADRERWLVPFHDEDQLRFGTPAVIPVPATVDDLDGRISTVRRRVHVHPPLTPTSPR